MEMVLAPNVRFAEIQFGDDLQRIALREMGHASRWLELVLLNDLRPPYIAAVASPGVLGFGDYVKIPASASLTDATVTPEEVYEVDLKVAGGLLDAADGDWLLVAGVPNLTQALTHHIIVDKLELPFHPEFGCFVRSLIGQVNGPTAAQLAAFYVQSALLEDARVQEVPSCVAEVLGDQVRVTATVVPVSGRPVNVSVVV